MGYEVYKLKNVPQDDPDIVIEKGTPEWDEAYQRWLDGKNPTDSKFWKKGIIAETRLFFP